MSSENRNLELVWDEWNKEHIKKHKVSVSEVEQACKSREAIIQSYLGRQIILGRTKKDRLLSIILSLNAPEEAYVVSARDMSKKERKIYYEKTKTT